MAQVKVVSAKKTQKPPPRRAPPRIAVLSLEAATALKAAGPKGRDMERMLVGGAMMLGVAVAGAAFIGGSLLDARDGLARVTDSAAAAAGFAINEVRVEGVAGPRAEEVRAAAMPAGRRSLLAADPAAVKTRVEALDWVEDARVARRWPGEVRIDVTRRKAVARWRDGDRMILVDATGAPVGGLDAKDFAYLPVLEDSAPGPDLGPVAAALDMAPELRRRVDRLIRVDGRRFDVRLRSGAILTLPADGAPEAIARAARLQRDYGLFERPYARFDLRLADRVVLAPVVRASAPPQLAPGA